MLNLKPLFLLLGILIFNNQDSLQAEPVATLYSTEGSVEGRKNDSWSTAMEGQDFDAEDALRTNQRSTAGIKFKDGFLVRLKEKTKIEFSKSGNTQPVSINEGTGYFFSRKPEKFPEIRTPQVSASVRGTEFVVEVNSEETKISVIEGAVDASNDYGSVSLGKGEMAITRNGTAPVKQILLNPLDAVQWTLYYPATFNLESFSTFSKTGNSNGVDLLRRNELNEAISAFKGNTWQDAMGRALAFHYQGDSAKALNELEQNSSIEEDFLILKSGLHLSLGETLESRAILDSIGSQNTNPDVLAQRAITDLVMNRKDQAKLKVEKALTINPDSSAALLVNSYVEQSYFNLQGARESIEKILKNNPEDSLAETRLAEILLGFDDIDAAKEIAEEAVEKNPTNENAFTILGYVFLSRYDVDNAILNFNRALKQNSSFASAHLGKGLALIKQGNLPGGRIEIEIATQTAPNISLYRSYLGKAFFEEKKNELSEQEYNEAIELDKNDPTPYLYRSFLRLSQHRPVEALADIESSIKRNDNRSVFRSKLLLDKDEAVRGTSLGKIYNRVGFNELARVEAIKSLNKDYSNYSAHFLLADLYRDSNLNSNAQVTENLIGRLLVPVNYNSNAVDLVGSQASINEYTSLFSRPISRTRVTAAGDTATKDIVGGADQTITTEQAGVRVGYIGQSKDGFRDNDFQRQNQVYTQGQYQLLENDTLVWDATIAKNNQGDILVNTDPYSEDSDLNNTLDSGLVRGGFHHNFSQNSHLIMQAFYNHGSFKQNNANNQNRISSFDITENGESLTSVPFGFQGSTFESTKTRNDIFQTDLQHIFDSEYFSLVSGTSIHHEELDNRENSYISSVGSQEVLSFLNGLPLQSSANVNQNSERAYVYSKTRPVDWVTFDAGVSYTHLQLAENPDFTPFTDKYVNREAWDPKLGMLVQLQENFSLRAAYTKTLGRTERGSLGPIEPTFVGGFNQLVDGIRGSEQELAAVGFDSKMPFTRSYFGSSFQNRQVSLLRPFSISNLSIESGSLATTANLQDGIFSNNAEENRVSSYFYQILSNQLSFSGNHDWEKFNQAVTEPDFTTNRFVANLRYFDSSGFFAFAKNTWRNQNISNFDGFNASEMFSITDAGVGYEFDYFHGFTTLEFKNIFDQKFQYSAMRDESFLLPTFGVVLRMSYNF